MEFVFLDMAGKTLFTRNDAERAQWTVEEMSLELEFPRIEGKVVSIGQRVFFKDPDTGEHQIYEIKQAKTYQPDNYQSIVAEHICISELTDSHTDNTDIEDETVSSVLSDLLTNTEWNVGTVSVNPTSSASISRGSIWNAITTVKSNWNVYIEPRVILQSNGSITRYLDVKTPGGTWNGLRFSIDKNMLDPSVTYDDTNVVTALYGYGGTVNDSSGESTEITFADVVWEGTQSHPPKPYGYKFLEDPRATQEFGRNNHPRFGFYQNSDIKDGETLLEKTWEVLSSSNTPDISIEGTVADLYRMGYADQPIKLHDLALVEILPSGFQKQIEIIKLTVDLLDPSATTLTIGSYIPNIIYINKETNESATGGGAGNNNKSEESSWQEFRTSIQAYKDGTGMQIKAVQNDIKNQAEEIAIQSARLEVTYNKIEAEVVDRRNADGELSSKITQTATSIRSEVNNSIAGVRSSITQTASQIRAEVNSTADGLRSAINVQKDRISLVVEGTGENAKIKPASIVAAINNGSSSIKISADHITLDGDTVASSLYGEDVQIGTLNCGDAYTSDLDADGDISATGKLYGTTLGVGAHNASWKSATFPTYTLSGKHAFDYGEATGYVLGYIITASSSTTIHYLGY